jgi:methylmalonyl-CoA/ethylmalonyl-CoA epimerase
MANQKTAKANFTKVHHIGIVVRDINKTIKRLESLGIGPFKPFDVKSLPPFLGEPIYKGKLMEAETKVYTAKLGEVEFEIFEPVKGSSPWQDFLDSKGEGIHHIGIQVEDLDKEVNNLCQNGASIMLNGRWEGGGGGVYVDLGTGELIVELYKR